MFVLLLTKWADLACASTIFTVNSGLPATASVDPSTGQLTATAAFSSAVTFRLEANGK